MSSELLSSVPRLKGVCVLKECRFGGVAVCAIVPLISPSALEGRTVSGITEVAASILRLQIREPRQQQVIATVKELLES